MRYRLEDQEMTSLLSKTVSIPLPVLLAIVFAGGLIVGIVIGVTTFSYGFDKAQEEARLARAAEPRLDLSRLCPPALPPAP